MGRQITVRGVSDEVSRKLRETAAARGISVNSLILELLTQAVGGVGRKKRLERYATATAEDADALDEAVRAQRVVDPRDWDA